MQGNTTNLLCTQIVGLDLAKRLKAEGYHKPCEHFYLDKKLPFVESGLKKTKNGEVMNHNAFDEFTYSAPTLKEGLDYLLGVKTKVVKSTTITLKKLDGYGNWIHD